MIYPPVPIDKFEFAKYYKPATLFFSNNILSVSEMLTSKPVDLLTIAAESFKPSVLIISSALFLMIFGFFICLQFLLYKSLSSKVKETIQICVRVVNFKHVPDQHSGRLVLAIFAIFQFYLITFYSANSTTRLVSTIEPQYIETLDDIVQRNCSVDILEGSTYMHSFLQSPIESDRRFAKKYSKIFKYYKFAQTGSESFEIEKLKQRITNMIQNREALLAPGDALNSLRIIRCKVISMFDDFNNITVYISKKSFFNLYNSYFAEFVEPYKAEKIRRLNRL